MSVKFHEAYALDSQQDQLLWWDDFLGDQLQDEWRSVGTAGGSGAVIDQQTGGVFRLTTGGVLNDTWRIDWTDIRSLHVDQRVSMEIRIKLNSLSDIDSTFQLRFDMNNYIDFRYRDTVGATWYIRTTNGGAQTASSSGINATTNYVILRIEAFPIGEVHFFIDGVEAANSPITTNIPDDATDYLQPYLWIQTKANAVKTTDVDYVVVRQDI